MSDPKIPENNDELVQWTPFIANELRRYGRVKFHAEDMMQSVFLSLIQRQVVQKFWTGIKERGYPLTVVGTDAARMLGITWDAFCAYQTAAMGTEKLPPVVKDDTMSSDVADPRTRYYFTDVLALSAVAVFPDQGTLWLPEPKAPEVRQWCAYLSVAVRNASANVTRTWRRRASREFTPTPLGKGGASNLAESFEDTLVDETGGWEAGQDTCFQFELSFMLRKAPGLAERRSEDGKTIFELIQDGYSLREAMREAGLTRFEQRVLQRNMEELSSYTRARVMDRVARLLIRAAETRRKLFTQLPWGYRLATIFLSMDGPMLEAWGRQMGALMLQAGVDKMPDPGPKWNPAKPNVRNLPRGYCQDLAKRAYQLALKTTGNPALAGDAMQDYMLKIMSGAVKLDGTKDKSSVDSYILNGVTLDSKYVRRKQDSRREQSTSGGDDDEESTLDLVDEAFESNPYWSANPQQFKRIEDVFPREIWRNKILPATTKVHPDMGFFFALLEDGYTAKEIVEGDMLPDFSPQDYKSPVQTWNAKVQQAKKIIRDMAREYGTFN